MLNVHLDHDEAALPERRALHGESLGSSRVSLVEVVVLVVGHFAAAVLRFSEIQVGYVEPLISRDSFVHKFQSTFKTSFDGIITLMSDSLCGSRAELRRIQPQLHFIQLQHQFQLLLLCSDTSKNMIKIILPFFVNKCQFL